MSRLTIPLIAGPTLAILLAYPLAALFALIYRFPVPFGGYASGVAAIPRALVAVTFYGVMGGFPALALAGAVGAAVARRIGGSHRRRVWQLTMAFAFAVAFLGVALLSVLDRFIGPW